MAHWCALSETAPHEGTLELFPNVILSNAYTILRPFFRLKATAESPYDVNSWEFGQYPRRKVEFRCH